MVLMPNAAVVIVCGWVAIFVISQAIGKRGGRRRRRRRLSRGDQDSGNRGSYSVKVFPGWLSVETTCLNRKLQQWGFRYRRGLRLWYSIGTLFGTVGMGLVVFILVWDVCRTVLMWSIWSVGLERRPDIQQQYQPWTGPSSRVITPVIPGVNMPWGEVGYLWCATALAITIHEVGHALAASAQGVRIEHIAFFLIVVFPGAWVALDSADMDDIPPVHSLAIFSAGVWHNIAAAAFCWIFLTSLFVLFTPFYTSDVGLVVASIPESSPFLAHLHPGDVIYAIDRNPIGGADAVDLKLKGLFSASVFGSGPGPKLATTADANGTRNRVVGPTVNLAGGTAWGQNDSHDGWHRLGYNYGYCVPNSIWQGKEEGHEVKLDEGDSVGYTNRWATDWSSAQAFVPNATLLGPNRDVSSWNKFSSGLHEDTESSGLTDGGGAVGGVGGRGGWWGNVIPQRMNLRSINDEWLLRDQKGGGGLDNLHDGDMRHSVVGPGFASFSHKCEEKGWLVFEAIYCEEGAKMKGGDETVEVAAGREETTAATRTRDGSQNSGRRVATHPPLRAVCLRAKSIVSASRCHPGMPGGSCECSLGSACLVPKLHLGDSLLRVSFICGARNSCDKAGVGEQHPRGRWEDALSVRPATGFVSSRKHRNESALDVDPDPRLDQQGSRMTTGRHILDARPISVWWHRRSLRTFSGDGHHALKAGASREPSGCAKVSQGYFMGRCESNLVFVGDPDVLTTALRFTEYYPRAWLLPHEWSSPSPTPSLLFLLIVWLPWGIKRLVISVFHVSIALALLNMAPVFGLDGEAALNAWLMILMPGLSPKHHRQVMKSILWICTALLATAILPPLVSLLVFP